MWDGRTVFCRGTHWGRPVFGHSAAPAGLATVRQLRTKGLRPGGQDVAAWLVFGHRRPFRREEIAALYRVDQALPVRPMTPGRVRALEAAMRARRTCPECGHLKPYVIPTSTRQCWDCAADEINNTTTEGLAA